MARIIPTGEQCFLNLRKNNLFYVDKTKFIQDWWNRKDGATLITRPRSFGKTLMLDTVRTFFSPEFFGCHRIFEGFVQKFMNIRIPAAGIFVHHLKHDVGEFGIELLTTALDEF